MRPRVKIGLLAGAISLVPSFCVLNFAVTNFGLVAPSGVALAAGALAGYFAARQEDLGSKRKGAAAGMVAGTIAGGCIELGAFCFDLFLGALLTIGVGDYAGGELPVWLFARALQSGLVGLILAALAGAATGYLGTPTIRPFAEPPQPAQKPDSESGKS